MLTMKQIAYLVFSLLLYSGAFAQQVTTTVDSFTGDTTVSTSFDTLNVPDTNSKNVVADRVVGVRTTHKGENTYWLFFYFSTADLSSKPVKISPKNYAYFLKTNNEYLRIPYKGKTSTYSGKDNAGFFVDITNYLSNLQFAEIQSLRFETSELYHEVVIPKEKMNKISDIINTLLVE